MNIAILGKLKTKYDCPYFDNADWEVWSMNLHNDHNIFKNKVDKFFDLHISPKNKESIHLDDFPLKELEKFVGGQYFNNISAILIAYAIFTGAKKIYLAGMQFIEDSEGLDKRLKQYYNVREMIWFAKGQGIEVEINEADKILMLEYIRGEKEDYDS